MSKMFRARHWFMLYLTITLILFLLTSCAPYLEYQHISDPQVDNDGYDMICAGSLYEKNNFDASVGVCDDYWRDGMYAHIRVRYVFRTE